MAISDKNIIITPHNNGLTAQPEIFFGGSGGVPIRLRVLDDSLGTLSWEGSAGQLFSINNNLTSGSIFSVNDVSGIPSIDVNANGTVSIAGYTGNVGIGLTGPTVKFQVTGGAALFGGGVTFASTTDHAGVARFAAGITANTIDITGETRLGGHVIISRGVTIGGGGGVLNPLGGITGATFTATIDVTGAARFNGGATASVLDVTNAARFNGGATASALNVTNVTRLNGGVTASTLDVSGTSRFAGTASFNDVSLGLCAGVGRFGTIQSTGTGQMIVAIPSGILLPGTTQAGFAFNSDNGVGGVFATNFQTTTLSANRTITLPDESGTVALRGANTFSGNQTVTGSITATQGFTFGSGTTFLAFYPDTAANGGGVWQRQGIFQIGASIFNDINAASFIVNPSNETHGLYGNFRITTDQTYQAAQNTLTLNISSSHTGRPLRVVQGATTIAGIEPSGFLLGAGLNPAIVNIGGLGGLTIGGSPIGFSNLGLRLSHTSGMAGAFSSVDTFAADFGGTPTRLDFNNLTIVGGSGVAIGSGALNPQTSGYTLTATDNGKVVTFNSASALVCGVDTAAGATGFSCTVIQLGTGGVRFARSGVTLNSYSGLTLAGQHAAASLVCYQTNVFNISGNLVG